MNTASQQSCATDSEVLQFWSSQAQLQRTASDAVADYLSSLRDNRPAPVQDSSDRLSH
ncbi:hypothetical protein [Billgrantia montanilacus]|nr:hypothetical protein [Halomonas montanilacus]